MANHSKKTENEIKKLAARIKQLRKSKGHNNSEFFAYEKNINRSQYGKYENGVDMRYSSLLKILDALDVSLKDFFSEGFD
jgi:transcriptional regulator with XRE-family HTH domain